ncbi:alcohol dehydrogenase catalytic domain-containing protein [uncultured Nocardioides sp.]|uniref:alcohol dehydrogenase catalytic domain-containing protein n=1 Tax=uncultured Nocardioides sp. TaxID=198441 RepID=UPI00260B407C|nr:alcohol dehydrogenase catalytic domain-containing protein [uncultured Nocardioides sp.]
MRAVRYFTYGERPRLGEIHEPACPADGVLVRVEATGVCGSDHHAWRGRDPVPLPMVPGHEYAGTVAEVGPEVSRWAVGDRVTVPFVLGCGRCDVCLRGHLHVCPHQQQPGFTRDGSWAELVAVPAAQANLVRLPDSVSMSAAAALGCRFATAARAVRRLGRPGLDDWVVVHGCGGVGLSSVMVAYSLGARVLAIDPDPASRDLAVELGAEVTLDPTAEDVRDGGLVDAVRDLTGGGAAVTLDAVGSAAILRDALLSLRPRGRHVQVGLLFGDDATPTVPMDLVVARELVVLGSHGMPAPDYDWLLAAVADGSLDPTRLVTREVGLAHGPAEMMAFDAPGRSVGITVLRP